MSSELCRAVGDPDDELVLLYEIRDGLHRHYGSALANIGLHPTALGAIEAPRLKRST